MNSKVMIEARGLSIGYKKNIIHESLDFELSCGEVVCLMGLNGAGKSTLIKTLCGFINPLGGSLRIEGEIGVVLTDKGNAGGLTVYEMVSLGRYKHTGYFGTLRENDHKVIQESLEAVGIAGKADRYMSEISDGEKQKAFIAKALAQECPIIILDEPTAFLDVTSRIETMALLRKLSHNQGKAVLISTHDLDNAINFADRLWLLSKERPLVSGAPSDLVGNGTVEDFFKLRDAGTLYESSSR